MTLASGPAIRGVTAGDHVALASFKCRDFRQPYTAAVELVIREHLATALERGDVRGLGLFDGSAVLAVAAWVIDDGDPPICTVPILAVAHGHQGRGHGRLLKTHVLQLARAEGAVAVVSDVHRDNDAMLNLNASLGANIELADHTEMRRCTIPLT